MRSMLMLRAFARIGKVQRLPDDEDVNTPDHSEPEPVHPEEPDEGDDNKLGGDHEDDWEAVDRAFYTEGNNGE